MPLSTPQQSGDILKPADIQNHVMVVAPVEYIPHLPNVNTKPGEQSPAIRCNVADFSVLDQNGQPALYRGVLWFNQMLHSNLKRQIGQFILGMMAQGQATPGKNAPFQLIEVTDAAWQQHCGNWLDNTPEGDSFQADAINDQNQSAASEQVAQAATSVPAAPPAPVVQQSAGPVPGGTGPQFANDPSKVAGPPPLPSAPSLGNAPSAPAAPAAPAASPSAPSGDLAAMLANLPADQQAAILANLGQQGQASS